MLFRSGVAARAVSEAVRPDYVVIGEASGLNLKIGQRGRAEIVVETFGVPCHSANPEKGINAVYQMTKVFWENWDMLRETHAALQKADPKEACSDIAGVEIHDGAARYYRESGLIQ